MKSNDVRAQLKAILPTPQGVGIFLSDGHKVIAIFVDPFVASAITMFARGMRSARPMTHDLIMSVLAGLNVRITKVVISDLKEGTFHARLYLRQENELGQSVVEIDARPSDSIALAIAQKCPVFVKPEVWEKADDMAWALEEARKAIRDQGNHPEDPLGSEEPSV
jgi:bifunctional DNase/RNase